jgi:hypothetical protein
MRVSVYILIDEQCLAKAKHEKDVANAIGAEVNKA